MAMQVMVDRGLVRAGVTSTRHVLARITAPAAVKPTEQGSVNVALVLDRSGSMAGEGKIGLARRAVQGALELLRPTDRFSLVVYDSTIDILSPSVLATPEAKWRALRLLDAIEPRGSTDLGGGWLAGCEQVAASLSPGVVTRVLLLTDGLANCGIRDASELSRHAAELRMRGVSTSTFGVGHDFDERLLGEMAHEGGGNFYFIEGAAQIPAMLVSELREALEVTVHGAALSLRSDPAMSIEVLDRHRMSRGTRGGEARVDLGDLSAGQVVSVVLSVKVPPRELGTEGELTVALEGDGWGGAAERHSVVWCYDSHQANDRQPRCAEVDREVAAMYAARARAEATEANRSRDFTRARRVIEGTRRRIARYANNDPQLNAVVQELERDGVSFCRAMDAPELKASYFAAEVFRRSRNHDGSARR